VTEATESAAPRFVGAVAVALPAGLLVQALADHAGYRHPVVPVAVWLGMLAVAAWLMPRARAGNLSNTDAAVAIAVAVAAVTAIGLDSRATGAAMNVDWTILGVIWLLALLALITRRGCGSPGRPWSRASILSSSCRYWGSARWDLPAWPRLATPW
jgi:hypothetical protein